MRVLYLLHTDWNWIKQRSQFIVENLSDLGIDIFVAYKFSVKRRTLVKNPTVVKLIPCLFLPFGLRKFLILSVIDCGAWRALIFVYTKLRRIDTIIITHPLLAGYLPRAKNLTVIYDCHDDNAEFYQAGALQDLITKNHTELLRNADKVIYSSRYLREKYCASRSGAVIRNGHNLTQEFIERQSDVCCVSNDSIFNVFYFGTVSEWFDQDLLQYVCESHPRIRFTIIGPCDVIKRQHPRICFIEAKPHDQLIELCRNADAFIMPFQVTELISGVDPVKLYEYIGFGVPVISVFYDELEHFRPHVNFYASTNECVEIIGEILSSSNTEDFVSPRAERHQFLLSSSWLARAGEVIDYLGR